MGHPMGYSIGVPIGVPLYCSIWTNFYNNLMSYFIYPVVKAMEAGWSFVKKLDKERPWFLRYWHLKFTPEKLNSSITISVSKLQVLCCSPYRGRTFRIVAHCYAVSFSRKLILCETNNIFYSRWCWVWHKDNNKFWKFIKNEHEVTLESFRIFTCVISYLHSKNFAWKRDYIISQKLQMPQDSTRPF